MNGLNRVTLFGSLGADPDLRYTQAGQPVLNFRMATTESYLDRDKQRKERTDWHTCCCWGKRGEALAKILVKGSTILVEGSLRSSSYEDREGNKRYKTEVNVTNVVLAGGKRAGGGESAGRSGSTPRQEESHDPADDFGFGGGSGNDDDIPF